MCELVSLGYGLAALLLVIGVTALCAGVKAAMKKTLKRQNQTDKPG